MNTSAKVVVLRGAHVIDPGRGLDQVADIAVENGKIRSLDNLPADAEIIDLQGSYVTSGWIDIHVHIYGPR